MRNSKGGVRALLIDPGEAARAAFKVAETADLKVVLHPEPWPTSVADAASGFDVVLIGVDTQVGLQLVEALCAFPGAPPVIAVASRGFAGKSLEHVLVLAELRGACATIIGPADAQEFARAIKGVLPRRQPAAAPQRKIA